MSKADGVIEVVASFDTTGSMSPCIGQVRRKVESMTTTLFKEIPRMRMGFIAHGDYCDARTTYVTQQHRLSDDIHGLCKFIRTISNTGGGDTPECYELVLHEARSMGWTDAKSKVLVMIGDATPHPANYPDNKQKLDWRNEAKLLEKMGVVIYSVQCLNYSAANSFYREIAEITGGFHLTLDQFSSINDLIMGICYQQVSPETLRDWEEEVARLGRMSRNLDAAFATMTGRGTRRFKADAGLKAVSPGRFQVLEVEEDQAIKRFVEDNGLIFNKGRGFYEFTKPELIQEYKEVVLMKRATGDMFTGNAARTMIGLRVGERAKIKPTSLAKYRVFVQSTSYNRTLKAGTGFLYEVDRTR